MAANDDNPTPADDARDPLLELEIEKLVTGGEGLARHEGGVVFVPRTAPGDRVRARVVESKGGWARAELVELLAPGPDRTDAPCPHYADCGGCDLQHLTVDAQRRAKVAIVADCFRRLGGLEVDDLLGDRTPGGPDLGYRDRLRLTASPMGPYGLLRRGTHEVVPLDTCPVMPEVFDRDILPWLRQLPPAEQIVVRLDGEGGWLLSIYGPPARLRVLKKILAGLSADQPPAPGCVGLLYNNLPVWGRDHLLYEVAGHTLRVSARSFFQGNLAATEEAVGVARAWLDELRAADRLGPLLGDLFCGVGLFTLALADRFERVVALDSDPHACRDAENNIRRDAAARGKATVHQGPLHRTLATIEGVDWRTACCVVDPPRRGLGKEGAAALLRQRPRQILFMSCDPATLARDAAVFAGAGWTLTRLHVLDMFPHTAHIETLALLERDDP